VDRANVTLATIGVRELIERLEALRSEKPAVLVFDGDGTLWTGDVSEDVFTHAVGAGLIREDAREAVDRMARAFAFEPESTPSATAEALFAAYVGGRFPEREVCELMTWCYAGWSLEELAELARQVLMHKDLASRLNRELEPILEYARESELRCIVVSASPRGIVEEAASLWGIASKDIAAAEPLIVDGVIRPELRGPVPYAEDKLPAARALIGDAEWLASFGDNVFDIEMLAAARVAVAVRPKLELRMRLPTLDGVLLLE
jgi:phosphatidylglycerophosphatase C